MQLESMAGWSRDHLGMQHGSVCRDASANLDNNVEIEWNRMESDVELDEGWGI